MVKYIIGILPCAYGVGVRDLSGVYSRSESGLNEHLELSLDQQLKSLADMHTEIVLEQDEIASQFDHQFPIMEKFHSLTLHEQLELAKSLEPIDLPEDHDHELHEQFATSFAQAGIGEPHHAPMTYTGGKKTFIDLVVALTRFEEMYGPSYQITPENITWDWLRAGAPPLPNHEADIAGIAFQVQAREALRKGENPCPNCPFIDATIPVRWYTPLQNFWEQEVPHVGLLLTMVVIITISCALYASEQLRVKLALFAGVVYVQMRDRVDLAKQTILPETPKWLRKKVIPGWVNLRTRIRNTMPVPLRPAVRKVVNVLFGPRTRDQNGRLYRANPKSKAAGSRLVRPGQSEHGSPSIRSRSISAFSSSADRSPPRLGDPPPALN